MRKLRWLDRSVQKVTDRVGRPVARLLRDWVRGSVVAGSVVLSAIARALRADKRGFEATLERLSRGLGEQNNEPIARAHTAYLRRAGRATRSFDLIAIDLSDIQKPYGRKMPLLCKVRDGSKSTRMKAVIGKGWATVEIVAVDDAHRVLPLHRHPFSTKHPDYKSQTVEVRRALAGVRP